MQPSISRKLQVSLTASLGGLWLIAAISVVWVVKHETEELFNTSLQEMSQRILALAIIELDMKAGSTRPEALEPAEHQEYLTYQIFDQHGRMVMRSHQAPEQPLPASLHQGHQTFEGQHFYVDMSKDQRYVIKVAERADHRQESYSYILFYLLLPFGFALPITALIIYLTVKKSQASILSFGNEISRRDSNDLSSVDEAVLPVELSGIGEAINSLMRRLHMALEAERSFTANSAHELRTPIAAALAQLDVLRDQLGDSEGNHRVAAARSMIERLEQMTVKLLQLVRAESGKGLNLARMDINSLLKMLLTDLRYRSKRDVADNTPDQPVWIKGDVDAVGIIIQNLLENADKHASIDTGIRVGLSANGALTIMNDCDAISGELLERLSQRFVRANQTKSGSGIGLSIVDSILRQSEAHLVLKSPCYENGRGFSATVQFQKIPSGSEVL